MAFCEHVGAQHTPTRTHWVLKSTKYAYLFSTRKAMKLDALNRCDFR